MILHEHGGTVQRKLEDFDGLRHHFMLETFDGDTWTLCASCPTLPVWFLNRCHGDWRVVDSATGVVTSAKAVTS